MAKAPTERFDIFGVSAFDPKLTVQRSPTEANMKLFGYEEGNKEQEQPMRLSEASILTNPAELRAIAKLFAELADEMESHHFGHVHLADRLPGLGDDVDLILVKAE
jgi:hypothetical protein